MKVKAILMTVAILATVNATASTKPSAKSVEGFQGLSWGASKEDVKRAFPQAKWAEKGEVFWTAMIEQTFFYQPMRREYKPGVRFRFGQEGLQSVSIEGFAMTDSLFKALQSIFGTPHKGSGEIGGQTIWSFADGSRIAYSSRDSEMYGMPNLATLLYQSPEVGREAEAEAEGLSEQVPEPEYPLDDPPKVIGRGVFPDFSKGFKKIPDHNVVVHVEITVDKEGSVVSSKVVLSSGYSDLDKAAVEAARKWKFKPARHKGIPVKSKIVIPFAFEFSG